MLSRNRASRAIIPKGGRQTPVDPNKSAQSRVAENLDSLWNECRCVLRMGLRVLCWTCRSSIGFNDSQGFALELCPRVRSNFSAEPLPEGIAGSWVKL